MQKKERTAMKRDGRLPESELDIMLAVWEAGEEGATAPGILEGLARPLTASALHSLSLIHI